MERRGQQRMRSQIFPRLVIIIFVLLSHLCQLNNLGPRLAFSMISFVSLENMLQESSRSTFPFFGLAFVLSVLGLVLYVLCLVLSTLCFVLSVLCLVLYVLFLVLSVLCHILSILCLASSVLCLVLSILCLVSSVLCLVLAILCLVLSVLCLVSRRTGLFAVLVQILSSLPTVLPVEDLFYSIYWF